MVGAKAKRDVPVSKLAARTRGAHTDHKKIEEGKEDVSMKRYSSFLGAASGFGWQQSTHTSTSPCMSLGG